MKRHKRVGQRWDLGRFERLRSEAKDRREDDGTVPMSHITLPKEYNVLMM